MHRTKLNCFITILLTVTICLTMVHGYPLNPGDGFDTSRLDTSCEPCKDFYQFANGGWLKKNPLPAGYSRWGSSDSLFESNRTLLHKILEDSAKSAGAKRGSAEQLAGDFYASCMDEEKIEGAGAKPLAREFERIERMKELKELPAVLAHLHDQGVNAVFGFGSTPDAKNNLKSIAVVGQGGLSLPNRDYYTKDDERSRQIREEFVKHVTRMFELLGEEGSRAAAAARTVMAVQMKLAESSLTPVELRDPDLNYNKMSAAELTKLTPAFSWDNYFRAINAPRFADLNVSQLKFIRALNQNLSAFTVGEWKTYLRWQLISSAAPFLSRKFADEAFNFNGRVLRGTKEQLPRWKRCVAATDEMLGEALAQAYVKTAFTPESKARMKEMIRNLTEAFRERLLKLDWMSEETRKQALAKLEAFKYDKIGYPEKWRDYTRLEINRDPYVENVRRAVMFESRRDVDKIGKPVDRSEWLLTPPSVNAYYHIYNVEIVFPAGILQPPFFDPNADDAINYGAIGGVIGHEITHGFDDRGSKYDAQGNLRMWWTAGDRSEFDKRASCIVEQFSGYKAADGTPMIGSLVQGESIADLGGLSVAYDAYQKSLAGRPRPAPIDGFTHEQRFFLGWAQVWATIYTPESERLLATTDPHPIARFRVNGPLSNLPAFAAAFGCKGGDPMVRSDKDRCVVW